MHTHTIELITTIFTSVMASSGFWALIQAFRDKNDARSEMLKGLGHDRIMHLASSYIDRGYITRDEYDDLYLYLYEPYQKLGGNGSAKRIMQEIDKLEIR